MRKGSKYLTSLFMAIFCVAMGNTFAQQSSQKFSPRKYQIINWTVEDGIRPDLNHVLKDAKGFLWTGGVRANALLRFDGATFTKFFNDPAHPQTTIPGGISSLKEDSLHNIWAGTEGGLVRYDLNADTFTVFHAVIDSASTDRSFLPFWCSGRDLYCLEGGARIIKFDIRSLEKKNLLTLSVKDRNAIGVTGAISYAYVDTASGSIWFLEFGHPDNPRSGLMHVSLRDRKITHFGWPCFRNIPNHNHDSESMRFDRKRNSIWINSSDGLVEFSLADKKFHFVEAFAEYVKMKDYSRFVGIDIDRDGRIWLATSPMGIVIYDPVLKQAVPLLSDTIMRNKLGRHNYQIYIDRDGIVWITYWDYSGIYELLPYQPSVSFYPARPGVKDSLNTRRIGPFIPSDHGHVLIGTDKGQLIFDANLAKFYKPDLHDFSDLKLNGVSVVGEDTIDQKAWLLGPNGTAAYISDLVTHRSDSILFRNGSKKIDTISIESPLVFPYKNGLMAYDMNNGFFELRTGSHIAELVIPFKDFLGRAILAFNQKMLFVMNPNLHYSFEQKDGKWMRAAHEPDSLDWSAMHYDNKYQFLWVSTNNELIRFDQKMARTKTYTQKDGLSGTILAMQTDDKGNLWFVDNEKKIGRLDITTNIITTLSSADGYVSQDFDWWTPRAKDAQGNIYFGSSALGKGNSGMIQIFPDRYASGPPSSIYFKQISINYKPFSTPFGANSVDVLSLSHSQNSIGIETGIVDYYSLGKSHVRYKLEREGKPEDWLYGPANYSIRYEGLQPGHYKLTLQASNTKSEFNGPEKILNITISPPFWDTWWFRVLFVVAFISIVWSIIQYRSRKLKQRNVELEEKVLHRTKELKHSLEELRDTQTQLIQREKMASLGELTAGIAHEIQNPLNFIKNFSEVNIELIDELKEEQGKDLRDMETEKKILDHIQQNEEKVIQHGKRADGIVKGMLGHSRANTGLKEPTDLNALADEYFRLSYHGLRAKDKSFNALIETDFDATIGKININSQDVGRVLLNLFNNSFYSVNEKKKSIVNAGYEPKVRLSTKNLVKKIEIQVWDNGLGIPKKIIDKIYQPFFTTKPTGEGTGLGLSLSYDIITKMHGGEIKVDSEQGEYAAFTIILPSQA
jgi:signal transduction histidine kinase/streptogramin lyase